MSLDLARLGWGGRGEILFIQMITVHLAVREKKVNQVASELEYCRQNTTPFNSQITVPFNLIEIRMAKISMRFCQPECK